jgi:hypothetical protein
MHNVKEKIPATFESKIPITSKLTIQVHSFNILDITTYIPETGFSLSIISHNNI